MITKSLILYLTTIMTRPIVRYFHSPNAKVDSTSFTLKIDFSNMNVQNHFRAANPRGLIKYKSEESKRVEKIRKDKRLKMNETKSSFKNCLNANKMYAFGLASEKKSFILAYCHAIEKV